MVVDDPFGGAPVPTPSRRLARTFFKRPRPIRRFANRIDIAEVQENLPDAEDLAHWGEVVLLEDIILVVHRDGTMSRLWHVVTQLHGNDQLAQWDEVTRGPIADNCGLMVAQAKVHLPDGKTRPARREQSQAGGSNGDASSKIVQLSFSPLKPGVITELEEQLDHYKHIEVGPGGWDHFFLRSTTPCKRRRITLAISEPFKANITLHHTDLAPVEREEDGYKVYCWELRDVDGVRSDGWLPSPREFSPWIDFTTYFGWSPFVDYYRSELEPPAETPQQVKELANSLAKDLTSDMEKLSAVYCYAARDLRYGRHPSELENRKVRGVEMLDDLRGDCKDKSALMVSMLRELKIPAEVAVVLTSEHGRIPFLPSVRFDHAVVYARVDGQDLWLDPAAGPVAFRELPRADQGVQALILNREQPRFVQVPAARPEEHQVVRKCKGELDLAGSYRFAADLTCNGEWATNIRLHLLDSPQSERERVVGQTLVNERPGMSIESIDFQQVESLTADVSYRYAATLAHWARPINDLMLFRIPWSDIVEYSGPVSAASRREPLAAPEVMRMEEVHEIALPEGYTGYGMPYRVHEESPWVSYLCQIEMQGSNLVCRREMRCLGGVIAADRFGELKKFWESCARSDQADVVLVKRGVVVLER